MDRKKATEIEIKQFMQSLEMEYALSRPLTVVHSCERKNVKAKLVAKICLINHSMASVRTW